MNKTYLYPYSAEEARRRNEMSLWRASHKANLACKEEIELAIGTHFDGTHLEEGCAEGVIREYGYKVADLLPSREDSYDRLIEEEHHQFALDEPSPENMLLQEEELHLLRAALLLLTAEEKELIDALFYQEMSEREYAQQIGLSQKGVNKRRHKILSKLRKIMKI